MRPRVRVALLAALAILPPALVALAMPAAAQSISIDLGQGQGVAERAIQLIALVTILSLAPSILIMVTCFTRIIVVLSLLRTAIGAGTAPPNNVMVALAIFLTAFIMAPTFREAYDLGVRPFHTFMLKHARENDIRLFQDLSREPRPERPEDLSLRVLVPAFMISELKRAFEIGFLLYLPFLVIDLVVASVLMAMGMMMLPPVAVSLPFKLIFFVLVDCWTLVAGSLVQSYGPS